MFNAEYLLSAYCLSTRIISIFCDGLRYYTLKKTSFLSTFCPLYDAMGAGTETAEEGVAEEGAARETAEVPRGVGADEGTTTTMIMIAMVAMTTTIATGGVVRPGVPGRIPCIHTGGKNSDRGRRAPERDRQTDKQTQCNGSSKG